MKQITLAKTFRDRVDETTVHEYPAGWTGAVSDAVAERAKSAEVLKGEPIDAPEPKADKPAKA